MSIPLTEVTLGLGLDPFWIAYLKDFDPRLKDSSTIGPGHLRTDTYFTCVSEHKGEEEDTLGRLSMWRAYGGRTGVALVMNNAAFQATAPSDVLKIYASPVAYFNPTKFIEKFDEVVTNIENEDDFIKQQDREDIKGRLFRMLAFAATCNSSVNKTAILKS